MKRLLPPLIFSLAAPLAIRAQGIPLRAATPQGFANATHHLVPGGLATGDLNGDGQSDAVLVLAQVAGRRGAAPDTELVRTLVVAWGQAGGGYRRGLTAGGAILCSTCGGAMGDPFEEVSISKGVLSVRQQGGSRELWTLTAKFRYQQGDFYQIGETYDVVDRLGQPCPKLPGGPRTGSEHRDANLVTGSFERVSVSEDCRLVENRRGRQPVKSLVRLLDYQPAP